MSTFHEEDSEVQKLMEQAPSSQEAPQELRAKLRMMASQTGVRRPSRWPALVATVGVAAVAVVATVVSMSPSRAWSFQRIVNAVDHANSFQFSVTSPGKDPKLAVQIAVDNGRFIIHTGNGGLVRLAGEKMEIYDPKENTVTELSMGGLIDPKQIASQVDQGLKEGMKQMDIRKMLDEFEAKYGKENIQVSPIYQRFGKSTYEVTLQKPGESEHVHMVVNADNDLPEHIEIFGTEGSPENVQIDLRFGGELDTSVASAEIPANAKHVDLDIAKMVQDGIKGKIDGDKIGKMIEEGLKNLPKGGLDSGSRDDERINPQ